MTHTREIPHHRSPATLPSDDITARHHAPCGTCGRQLDVTEIELLASLDHPLVCWPCDIR